MQTVLKLCRYKLLYKCDIGDGHIIYVKSSSDVSELIMKVLISVVKLQI